MPRARIGNHYAAASAPQQDKAFSKALNKFVRARQRPGQSPQLFYAYIRSLDVKLDDLPPRFLSGHFITCLLPELQTSLARLGIDSTFSRLEIVKQANLLWDSTLPAEATPADTWGGGMVGSYDVQAAGPTGPPQDAGESRTLKQAKAAARRTALKRKNRCRARQRRQEALLGGSGGAHGGSSSGFVLGPITKTKQKTNCGTARAALSQPISKRRRTRQR